MLSDEYKKLIQSSMIELCQNLEINSSIQINSYIDECFALYLDYDIVEPEVSILIKEIEDEISKTRNFDPKYKTRKAQKDKQYQDESLKLKSKQLLDIIKQFVFGFYDSKTLKNKLKTLATTTSTSKVIDDIFQKIILKHIMNEEKFFQHYNELRNDIELLIELLITNIITIIAELNTALNKALSGKQETAENAHVPNQALQQFSISFIETNSTMLIDAIHPMMNDLIMQLNLLDELIDQYIKNRKEDIHISIYKKFRVIIKNLAASYMHAEKKTLRTYETDIENIDDIVFAILNILDDIVLNAKDDIFIQKIATYIEKTRNMHKQIERIIAIFYQNAGPCIAFLQGYINMTTFNGMQENLAKIKNESTRMKISNILDEEKNKISNPRLEEQRKLPRLMVNGFKNFQKTPIIKLKDLIVNSANQENIKYLFLAAFNLAFAMQVDSAFDPLKLFLNSTANTSKSLYKYIIDIRNLVMLTVNKVTTVAHGPCTIYSGKRMSVQF